MSEYAEFVNEGNFIGEGSSKLAYRKGDYVLCTYKPDCKKKGIRQIFNQVTMYNYFKEEQPEGLHLLNPVLKYAEDYSWMISPYCSPVTEDVKLLDYNDVYYISGDEDNPHGLYIEDLVIPQNQGINSNGEVVIIDYGTLQSEFTDEILEGSVIEDYCLDLSEDNYSKQIDIQMYGFAGVMGYTLKDNDLYIKDFTGEYFEGTDIISWLKNQYSGKYNIVDSIKNDTEDCKLPMGFFSSFE